MDLEFSYIYICIYIYTYNKVDVIFNTSNLFIIFLLQTTD